MEKRVKTQARRVLLQQIAPQYQQAAAPEKQCITECLPLVHKGREAVLAALRAARARFPFPTLGLDTDNGGEFINEEVAAYCASEQITFTRGRPYEKRDQCFVEQKNGVVVRKAGGPWPPGGGAGLSATGRIVRGAALLCELLPALDEAGRDLCRRPYDAPGLRRRQDAA
jgi:hypothetical protein